MKLNIPLLSGAGERTDNAFRLAVGTMTGNAGLYAASPDRPATPCILAGADYPEPWVRDASFNAWYAGFIAPEASRNSLLAVLSGDSTVDNPANYWDEIIWAVGAWADFLHSGDREFLSFSLGVIERTLSRLRKEEFDSGDGLFRGGPCFQDGIAGYPDCFVSRDRRSGIIAWLQNPSDGAVKLSTGMGFPAKAFSTNCLYYEAMAIADRMRAILNMAPAHQEESRALCHAINRSFFQPATGNYAYLIGAPDTAIRQEGLGSAFGLLFDIVPPERAARLIAATHSTPQGIPCVWPPFERYPRTGGAYPRHSGVIWPQANAAWCCALVKNGCRQAALHEVALLAEKVERDKMFMEIYHPESGLPYGGLQEDGEAGIREWVSSRCQTWSATGFIRMVLSACFGLREDTEGLTASPVLPEDSDTMTLRDMVWRGTAVTLTAKRSNCSRLTVNGKPAEKILPAPGCALEAEIEVAR